MDDRIKKEIWSNFRKTQTIFLATSDSDQPRVRPVTMIFFNDRFWVGTGSRNEKVRQVEENQKAEFCLSLGKGEQKTGYVRGTCVITIHNNREIRKELARQMPYFGEFWTGPDDPNFALLELAIREIEYLKPGSLKVDRFEI